MTVGTAALIQSLKTAAKPGGKSTGEDQGLADGAEPGQDFVNLLKSMKNGGPLGNDKPPSAPADSSAESSQEDVPADGVIASAPPTTDAVPGVPVLGTAGTDFANDLARVLEVVGKAGAAGIAGADQVMPNKAAAATSKLQGVPSAALQPSGQESVTGQAGANATQASVSSSAQRTQTTDDVDRLFSRFAVPEEAALKGRGEVGESKSGKAGKSSGEAAMLPSGSVKILRQETHFAPTQRLSPIQQVGERLILSLGEQAGPGRVGLGGGPVQTEGPVLKTMEIQLTPVELGTVKVSLRLVGDSVEVTVKTSNPQTAEILKQDRHMLDQMLRATGYKPDAITIQAAGDDRPVTQSAASQHSGSQSGNASGGETAAGGQGYDGAAGRGGQGGRQPSGSSRDETDPSFRETQSRGLNIEDFDANRRDGGVYL